MLGLIRRYSICGEELIHSRYTPKLEPIGDYVDVRTLQPDWWKHWSQTKYLILYIPFPAIVFPAMKRRKCPQFFTKNWFKSGFWKSFNSNPLKFFFYQFWDECGHYFLGWGDSHPGCASLRFNFRLHENRSFAPAPGAPVSQAFGVLLVLLDQDCPF